MPQYPALIVKPKTGDESFHHDGQPTDFQVLDFWRWGVSDLVNNVTRGKVAEFLVSRALGLADCAGCAGGPCDLKTPSGLEIQVKSCLFAVVGPRELSRIEFDIRRKRAWNYETNLYGAEVKRHAAVYVFASCIIKTRRRWTHWTSPSGRSTSCRRQNSTRHVRAQAQSRSKSC